VGQQVVAMMGGMGRVFDGGYAEYTCVPATQVIAFRSSLPWPTLGAVPEMLQTSYGSLTVGLYTQPGGSSSSAAAPPRSGWPPRSWPSNKA
jgi:NADPH2:quinone reductase